MQRRGIRHPARLVPLGFLALIALGTLLLMLPLSKAGDGGAPWLTAMFTAVSAACVTGLAVVDTPTYWSGFGQAVILGLIQVGGLGIMTGATLLGLLVAQRLRLHARLLAQAETRSLSLGDVTSVLKLVIAVTVAVEAIVAIVLVLRLHLGHGEPLGRAAWNGIFHAVSAFNNAGFSTYSDNLVGFASDAWILLPIMMAIILGGLGFPVLQELRREGLHWRTWSVHTKITLLGSAILLLGGTIALYAYEAANPSTLGGLDGPARVLNAAFHSVGARTAGFNTVDMSQLQAESLAVHYVLMFIGGGSAGTAGGIKVTTFFLLGFVVWAEVRGAGDTTAFRRRICSNVQRQALAIALLGVATVAIGTQALLTLTDHPLDVLAFEAISAFATVGLSTGITPGLPPAALGVLMLLMFVGRVGTITVATALALRAHAPAFRYPEERPIVG